MAITDETERVNKIAGGATLTKGDRDHKIGHFDKVLRNELNLQVKSFKDLKTSHIAAYVQHELDAGKAARSLQNDLAAIRAGLSAAGRKQFAQSAQISNKAMGVGGASRDGKHRALPDDRYQTALAAMHGRDAGAAAAMVLQRELGLRAREAVQSVKSLVKWERQLARGEKVSVIHGTKGGRPRETAPTNRQHALQAVTAAKAIAKENGGHLVRSASLEGAMRAYGRHFEALGLTEESASHSLRCMYAQERYQQHLETNDGDRAEALSATSLDLGHGDGRGTYVAQVYLC